MFPLFSNFYQKDRKSVSFWMLLVRTAGTSNISGKSLFEQTKSAQDSLVCASCIT